MKKRVTMKSVTAREALREQQHFLEQVETKQAMARLKSVYDEANDALIGRLTKLTSGGASATFDAHASRQMLVQVKASRIALAKSLAGNLADATMDVQIATLKKLESQVASLEKKYTGTVMNMPIVEVARLTGVTDKRRSSLLNMHKTSMASYGVSGIRSMEKQLAVSLATGESNEEAIERVIKTADVEWWQGERIVRTELAHAYNATQADGVKTAAAQLPDMMLRWCEHCTNEGAPMDNRVSVDSIAMHGQAVEPGGLFLMPSTAPFPDAKGNQTVPPSLVGLGWEFPPNRPNDRGVVQPWRPHWKIPAWMLINGKRLDLATT